MASLKTKCKLFSINVELCCVLAIANHLRVSYMSKSKFGLYFYILLHGLTGTSIVIGWEILKTVTFIQLTLCRRRNGNSKKI